MSLCGVAVGAVWMETQGYLNRGGIGVDRMG